MPDCRDVERLPCVALGCTNQPVRYFISDDGKRAFGICAFHVQSLIKYATDKVVRETVIPPETLRKIEGVPW